MLKSENVATPFAAVTVFVPDSVPGTSMPPLCPIAIVTDPVKLVTGLPRSSTAVTCTGGLIVIIGSVVLGCTVNARCVVDGFSATTVASQALGELKYQVHWGSTEPPAGKAYTPSTFIDESEPHVISVKAGGSAKLTTAFAIVTPYASAPAPTGIEPGSATVVDEPLPHADWCAPKACADVRSTPV